MSSCQINQNSRGALAFLFYCSKSQLLIRLKSSKQRASKTADGKPENSESFNALACLCSRNSSQNEHLEYFLLSQSMQKGKIVCELYLLVALAFFFCLRNKCNFVFWHHKLETNASFFVCFLH
jgi:hypothetical protein